MKKKLVLMTSMLLWLGFLCSCSNTDDIDTSESSGAYMDKSTDSSVDSICVLPIREGDGYFAISDFFNSELSSDSPSNGFFVNSIEKREDEVCRIIYSMKELQEIYIGDKDLPEIDFQHYFLVIGQTIMPSLGYKLIKQELVSNNTGNSPVLYLFVENKYEYKPTMLAPLYFWGIYPIMHLSSINIKIVKL